MIRAAEQAYAKLRAQLLGGEMKPKSQLTEERLAQITGVSRTPVREALRRLKDELLMVCGDTKRLFEANWSRDDIAAMFTLRQMLECHAAESAAEHLSDRQIA